MKDSLPFDISSNDQMSIPMILEMLELLAPKAMAGALALLGARSAGPTRTRFHCPVMDQGLRSACQAQSCRYWVDYAPSDNCLHAFMAQRQQDTLSLTDISCVTKIKLSSCSRSHSLALQQLRQNAVKDIFSFEDLDVAFILRPNLNVCVVCEALVGNQEAVQVGAGFVWCSKECVDEKTVDEARLEHRYGVPTSRLLQFLTYRILGKADKRSTYDAEIVQVISHALELTAAMTERLLRKHHLWHEEEKKEAKEVPVILANGDRRTLRRMKKLGDLHEDLQKALNARYKSTTPQYDAKAVVVEMERELALQ